MGMLCSPLPSARVDGSSEQAAGPLHPCSHSMDGNASPMQSSNAAKPLLKVFLEELSANPNRSPRSAGYRADLTANSSPATFGPGMICEKTLSAQ